eukprot:jgi/Chlat1/1094/Chrsp110S01548
MIADIIMLGKLPVLNNACQVIVKTQSSWAADSLAQACCSVNQMTAGQRSKLLLY